MPIVRRAPSLFLTGFLTRLPSTLADSFSSEQLAAIELHFGMRYRVAHILDWRWRVRVARRHFYIVVLAGRENR
jgi:hypothetical protein